MNSLFYSFFSTKLDLLLKIEELELKHGIGLLNRVNKEYDKSNFLSAISEINFGLFFDSIGASLSYEQSYKNQRPDWTIILNDQKILVEVLRLNPVNKQSIKNKLFESLADEIQKIPIGCLLYVYIDEEAINDNEVDIENCITIIEEWLNTERSKRDAIVIQNILTIEFEFYSENYEHVNLMSGFGAAIPDFRRLNSKSSSLLKKAIKYSELIDEHNLPYIICIYMAFETWIDEKDIFEMLFGSSVDDLTTGTGYHSLEDGLYYSSENQMNKVGGILLSQGGKYYYYHNYSSKNLLNTSNKHELQKLKQHYY